MDTRIDSLNRLHRVMELGGFTANSLPKELLPSACRHSYRLGETRLSKASAREVLIKNGIWVKRGIARDFKDCRFLLQKMFGGIEKGEKESKYYKNEKE